MASRTSVEPRGSHSLRGPTASRQVTEREFWPADRITDARKKPLLYIDCGIRSDLRIHSSPGTKNRVHLIYAGSDFIQSVYF
jgi:hypothetical protein